jgi:AMP-binding enzyme C-terminal domain
VFAVPSVLGDDTEEEIKVAVVARENSITERGFNEKELWEWLVKNIARFQVPSVIEFVPSISKTPTGKVEKSILSKEGGQRFEMIRPLSIAYGIGLVKKLDWQVIRECLGAWVPERYLSFSPRSNKPIRSHYPIRRSHTNLYLHPERNLDFKFHKEELFLSL